MPSLAEQVSALNARLGELAALLERPAPVVGAPASAADLDAVEQQLGRLPRVLRELLAVADGWTDLLIDDEGPLRVFSCAELTGPEYADFVAAARSRRGFKSETALQRGFVFGGNADQVLVITEGPQKGRLTGTRPLDGERVTHFCLQPPGITVTGSLAQVLDVYVRGAEHRLAEARELLDRRATAQADPLAHVRDAIEAFNYPGEMGEDVHDSVETLTELLAEIPRSSPALPALKRLLAELSRGYSESMRFAVARLRDGTVEVQYDGKWTDVMKVPAADKPARRRR